MSDFPEKSVTKMYGSRLLALQRVGGCQIFRKKRYVTLEWPLMCGKTAAKHNKLWLLDHGDLDNKTNYERCGLTYMQVFA